MPNENERLTGRTGSVHYGAVAPRSLFEDEIAPLLDVMDEATIGISTQTLVSANGSAVKPKRGNQLIAALSVTLGAFALGNVLGWSSPADNYLKTEKNISDNGASWIGATMAAGAATIVLPGGFMMDSLGRKNTMLALVIPFVGGWLLIIFANASVAMYIVGRIITGMMGGAFSLTAPTYTSETADSEIRGMLGSFFQLMVTVGILFVYILGGTDVSVVAISIICACVPVVFAAIFWFMPETPIHLLSKGKEEEARKSLQWFRGPAYDIEDEIRAMKESLEKIQREKLSFVQSFSTRAAKKGLLIALGLMLFQQLSGVNAVIFNSQAIFESAGSTLEPSTATIIIGVVQVVATFVSSQIVDRLGRRILLLLSDSVMCLCSVALGVFFYLKNEDEGSVSDIGWLPLVSLCLFIVVFSLGYGPIPWMMVGELFVPSIKGTASSLACLLNWILAFIVTKTYADLKEALGEHWTFWIFAIVSGIGTVFVFFIVPETKGKSLAQIQSELEGETSTEQVPEKY